MILHDFFYGVNKILKKLFKEELGVTLGHERI
jgi:hypothetical protein